MTRFAVALTALTLIGLTGCAVERERVGFTAREINDAAPEEVLAAAKPVLQREFGRMRYEPSRGRLVCGPSEYVSTTGTGTLSDVYHGRTTLRRTATFATGTRGPNAIARLRVDVERRDTERRPMTVREGSRLSDAPGYSAVETDAATTASQNEVWTFIRRDTQLESALLAEVQSQFAEPAKKKEAAAGATTLPAAEQTADE